MSRYAYGSYRLSRRRLSEIQIELSRIQKAEDARREAEREQRRQKQFLGALSNAKKSIYSLASIKADINELGEIKGMDFAVVKKKHDELTLQLNTCKTVEDVHRVENVISKYNRDIREKVGLAKEMKVKMEFQEKLNELSRANLKGEFLLEEIKTNLDRLRSNSIVTLWEGKVLIGIQEQLKRLENMSSRREVTTKTIDADLEFARGKEVEAVKIVERITMLENDAYHKEEAERRRSYTVNSVIEVLSGMGFSINAGPNLKDPINPASEVLLSAALPSGSKVDISIKAEGAISTDFKGYSGEQCANDLASFAKNLSSQFEIEYEMNNSGLPEPIKIKKEEKETPRSNDNRDTQKGSA